MTDHKATSEQWADAGAFASGTRACILELRGRVETLERRCEVQQDRHHRLALQVGHLEYDLVRDEDDLPQQHCLEAMDPPEANSQPTPNNCQIRTSLVKRVHSCIVGEPPVGHMQARSVIREVSEWLRERAGGTRASWLLDNELEQ
jgi:hypothetical protein